MDLVNMPVTLIVKAPNQKIADHTVECALDWTVKKLKEHLSAAYPSKPRENQQKLIYSGKLLHDHLTLKEVLRQYEDTESQRLSPSQIHTVHLVCAAMANGEHSPNQSHAHTSNSQTESHSDSSSHSSTNTTPPPTPSTDGLRHRPSTAQDVFLQQQMYGANHVNPLLYQSMLGASMAYPGYSPEQMMWMQQMYTQHMVQVMQYYQQGGMYMPPTTPAATHAEPAPQQQQNQPGNQANVRQGDPPIRMNAQGGAFLDDDEEDGVDRDWLDWVYTLCRFSIFLSIIYFYSTFGRFVMVFGLFLLVYLYQGGWLRLQRRRRRENREPQPPQQEEPAQPQPGGELEQPVEEPPQLDGDEQGSETQEETQNTQPPRPSALSIAWSFLTTFFSSLIPQQPPAVNAN